MKTPDQEVADRILEEFRKNRMLSEKKIKGIGQSLANGELRFDDWISLFDTDRLEKETGHGDESQ